MMKPRLSSLAAALDLGAAGVPFVQAGLTIFPRWVDVNLEIPDAPGGGAPVTVSDTRPITFNADQLTDISVWLRFEGSNGAGGPGSMWNGDLHVTLAHESGASVVLINRIEARRHPSLWCLRQWHLDFDRQPSLQDAATLQEKRPPKPSDLRKTMPPIPPRRCDSGRQSARPWLRTS